MVGVEDARHGAARGARHASRCPSSTPPARWVFLVTGEDKAEAVGASVRGLRPGPEAPASLVRPAPGTLTVLLDTAAAKHLR